MTLDKETLIELADRIEHDQDYWREQCRELHDIDPHPNVNGTCAAYLTDLKAAQRLIPPGHCWSICHDTNEVRAVVAPILTERESGFSAMPHGPCVETRALVAAALRARALSKDTNQHD